VSSLIGQKSSVTPAVCSHSGILHMVFLADNNSHDLLHVQSRDGINWERRNNLNQQSKFAPALIDHNGQLVVVFVANDASNRLLTSTWDERIDSWTTNRLLGGESSNEGPALGIERGALFVYFRANNNSGDLLVLQVA
jgi:hypothetical protein